MAYVTPKFNIQAQQKPSIWPETPSLLNGGINLVEKEYKLPENQSPKILNMWYLNGEVGIRYGQEYLKADETVELVCYGAYKFPYQGNYIKHCGTKIYKQDVTTGVSTAIFSGVAATKSSFFKFNNALYFKQAGNYVSISTLLAAAAVVPYIPTVIINRTPTGGGNTNENYNRLGKGFRNSFNGTGAATVYTLTDSLLDATLVTCTIGGVSKTETVDFTVNRTTGVVTFGVAPASGTNNVIITAYKTIQADIDSILNCLYAMPFGGTNDNRMFMGGNGTGVFYWTGITTAGIDPTYWAYNNYNIIGSYDENVTGFIKSFDTLTIHKSSGEIYGVTYSFNGTTGVFSTFPLATKGGCDCPNTIEVVNNTPVWLNSKMGVCILAGTTVGSQRNVFQVSRNVDPRLLAETNLTSASAIDYGGKYWLCVNDKVYLWDYFLSPYSDTGNPEQSAKILSWWYFDNINAGTFIVDDTLIYVNRATGLTVKFHKAYDSTQFYDFGLKISATFRYPLRLIGNGIYEFSVLRGFVTVRGDIKSSFTVQYFTSDDPTGDSATESIDVGSFKWDNFKWDSFTWGVMGPLFNYVLSPYEKNIRYFGCEFTNNNPGCDMNISAIEWSYKIERLIK